MLACGATLAQGISNGPSLTVASIGHEFMTSVHLALLLKV